MAKQLDILALEPFYGGARRSMLETIVRCSRHRWTVFKLPPRRIERRLIAAANWFAEQLTRHWAGRIDLLFTSEAMNLANLYRLVPPLLNKPSVVYFHDNQLPEEDDENEGPLTLINLNTAAAATEIWFNSAYHMRTFFNRATALVDRHRELSSRSPVAELQGKAKLMRPPIDMSGIHAIGAGSGIERDPSTLFVDTRDADTLLLNRALAGLKRRNEQFKLITVGPVGFLDPGLPRRTIPETDDISQARGMYEAGVVVSVKPGATCDFQVVRALMAGCRPVLPKAGVYREILPESLHSECLYKVTADHLSERLEDAMSPFHPVWHDDELQHSLRQFDAISACKAIDEAVEELVNTQPAGLV